MFIGTKIYFLKVRLNEKNVVNKLCALKNIYTNVGCGDAGLSEGWINVDMGEYKNVHYAFDCRKKLPFSDNSVKGVFTEHFFEHLDYDTEVPYFLRDCYRVMQQHGVLRIIVPDAEKYLRGYCEQGWDYLKATRPLDDNLKDLLMGVRYQTKMQLINEVFRQGGSHKYAWDFETMKLILLNAGFTNVQKMSYLKSNDSTLEIDQEIRKPESLYVDAIK